MSSKSYTKSYSPLFSLFFFISFVLGIAPLKAFGFTASETDTLRLFLIGNSFSHNATRYLPQLAEEGGHPLKIGRAELGGCSLQRHWEIADAAEKDPNDPKGKAYHGKSLRQLLSEGTWDVVTLQQNSMNSGDFNTYMPYAQKLFDLIKSIQPKARIVIHQTWAYRIDSKKFTQTSDHQFASNAKEMWQKSRASYHTLAARLGTDIIPVGDAFWKVATQRKTAYQPDTHYNFENPQYPALPNQTHSLHVGYHWDNAQKLAFDSNHANEAGCYLGGLVWYSFLFGESPSQLKFRPQQVDEDFADKLKSVAHSVVRTGNK